MNRTPFVLALVSASACSSGAECDLEHFYSFNLVHTASQGDCRERPELPPVTLLQLALRPDANALVVTGSQNWGGQDRPGMSLISSSFDDNVCGGNLRLTGAWTDGADMGVLLVEFLLDDRRLAGYATLTWNQGDCVQAFVALGATDD
jgi:hypothetical protein